MKSPVRVVRIWTDYVNRKGKLAPVDKVEYCQVGMSQKSTTIEPVSRLMTARMPTGDDDVAAHMAQIVWQSIKPAYEAFKAGSDVPEHGTPLGAWPALSPEQAAVLKQNGIRTIEEVAGATDTLLQKIQLPNARHLVEQAKMFLAASDKSKVINDLAAKDAEIARLKEEQDEMKRILLDMQAQITADKPRRGRPPRVESDEVAA